MKAVVIGALAATAFAETAVITYVGTYKAGTPSANTDCCPPSAAGVTIAASGSQYTATWKYATGCAGTVGGDFDDENFAGSAVTKDPTTGDLTYASTVGGHNGNVVIEAPANANEDFTLNLGAVMGTACTVPLLKKPATAPSFPGVYTVDKSLGATCCYPSGDVVLRSANTNDVKVDFTFATCTNAAVSAFSTQPVSGTGTPDADTKAFTFQNTIGGTARTFAVDGSPVVDGTILLGLPSVGADCAVTLAKKSLPTLTYNKVFGVDQESSATGCCYPAGDITLTQDASTKKVTLGFTFESDCTPSVKGKTITAVGDVDTVTGDATVTDSANTLTYKLVAPQTATGDWSLDLSSIATGCSTTLETKSGYVLGLGSLVALSLSYIMF